MNANSYREKVIKVIGEYLQGSITQEAAANWALDVIRTDDWEKLSKDVSNAVHLLFDLHDADQTWCPSREELEQCKAELEKNISTV